MFMYLRYITAQYFGIGDKIILQLKNIARLKKEYIESNQVHWRPKLAWLANGRLLLAQETRLFRDLLQ